MELREYVRILLKSWWIIISLALVSLTGALLFSYTRTPIYESSSTYIVRLESFDSVSNTMYGLDTLSRQQRIFATYCQVITSNATRTDAYAIMNIDPAVATLTDYTVSCNVLPDSNVLRVAVQGPSPAVATRLNEAIGTVGVEHTKGLYNYFPLDKLDPVIVGETPIYPNPTQNGILGAALGIIMGVSLAFIIHYLRSPLEKLDGISIRDRKLGTYNERYFQQRLVEEIHRARARNHPISVALLRLIPDEDFVLLPELAQEKMLRQAAVKLEDNVGQGDIVAYMGQQLFGILLTESPGDEAQEIISSLHETIRSQTFRADEYTASFSVQTGIVESNGGSINAKTMITKAGEALRKTNAGHNSIQLLRASARPLVASNTDDAPPNNDSPTLALGLARAGSSSSDSIDSSPHGSDIG
jgi:diguanylate cyclase (GGDEF)-like protein